MSRFRCVRCIQYVPVSRCPGLLLGIPVPGVYAREFASVAAILGWLLESRIGYIRAIATSSFSKPRNGLQVKRREGKGESRTASLY